MVEKLAKYPRFAKIARKLRRNGKGYRSIANKLEEKGFDISHQGVKNYLDKVSGVGQRILQEEKLLEEQAAQEIVDTTKQMRKINKELWNIVERLKSKMDEVQNASERIDAETKLANVLNKIMSHIKLSNKLMGKFVDNQTVNISYLDMSVNITNHLQKLESRGIIKIVDKDRLTRYQ